MFVNFKFSTMKTQVSVYLNPMWNSVFQFSVADFRSVKPGLTKHHCFTGVNGTLDYDLD